MSESTATLSEIWIYPVKSLGGVKLVTAQVEERGLQYDRRWLLVDENGMFMTQRGNAKMALTGAGITEAGLRIFAKNEPQNGIIVPFESEPDIPLNVKIWKDHLPAFQVSAEADAWLSAHFEKKVHLVQMPDSAARLTPADSGSQRRHVSFADDFPFLLISDASLADLNSRLPEPVTMDRFRPNLVISGTLPFEEDQWKTFSISDIPFEAVSPCERCVVVTIDQQTGKRNPEPLKTLAHYRRLGKKILFGQNVIGLGSGTIRVGDTVEAIRADQ